MQFTVLALAKSGVAVSQDHPLRDLWWGYFAGK
jgi:hypothetical protein